MKLKDWPTVVKPFCESKKEYQELLEEHVGKLSYWKGKPPEQRPPAGLHGRELEPRSRCAVGFRDAGRALATEHGCRG
jgi:hypothetical protein